ncbi:DUF721 domain-containing protein [Candidatus Fonsibacter ubiquis]|jgi:hypothetical protein|uniref:DUF721 domain-containing protein n=1 Tax=Candidatus Fonsibacter ubiquis TaxID=1925548 RepID=UPI000C074898|nr:DUF721 domain-containing protein [Candidatus Fonsibacter ubiquis]
MVLDKSSNKAFAQGLRPLQSLLSENVKKILKKDGFVYFEIIKNWKNIVGEKMFKDVSPVKIKKINNENILSINVNKNVMIEIEYSRDQIIEKINGYLGFNAIHKIQINSIDTSFKIKKRFTLSDNILKKINEIKNKNLKEIFLKLNK